MKKEKRIVLELRRRRELSVPALICLNARQAENKNKNKIIFFLRFNDVALFVVILVVEVTGLALLFLTCFFR